MPGSSNHHEFEFCFSTTHNTPRFAYSCGPDDYGLIYDGISKDDSFASHPGYMANTKSFRAKLRSRSAPKQRPEYGLGLKKSDGLIEVECGLDMEKSKSPSMLKSSFKNYVMDWKVVKKSTRKIMQFELSSNSFVRIKFCIRYTPCHFIIGEAQLLYYLEISIINIFLFLLLYSCVYFI
ncbi:hypothetical protein HanPI659440_Chr12g0443941 [Helianthus annuus]|nr:hypothetical protein HanPI659440_Chr12g0443941 [Helianthus annuus]